MVIEFFRTYALEIRGNWALQGGCIDPILFSRTSWWLTIDLLLMSCRWSLQPYFTILVNASDNFCSSNLVTVSLYAFRKSLETKKLPCISILQMTTNTLPGE
jgi:hypothetical protein